MEETFDIATVMVNFIITCRLFRIANRQYKYIDGPPCKLQKTYNNAKILQGRGYGT